jgi:hypothetical protein
MVATVNVYANLRSVLPMAARLDDELLFLHWCVLLLDPAAMMVRL